MSRVTRQNASPSAASWQERGHCLVFDVDYKLAPEYPYPYALEEGWDVVRFLRSHAADLAATQTVWFSADRAPAAIWPLSSP